MLRKGKKMNIELDVLRATAHNILTQACSLKKKERNKETTQMNFEAMKQNITTCFNPMQLLDYARQLLDVARENECDMPLNERKCLDLIELCLLRIEQSALWALRVQNIKALRRN